MGYIYENKLEKILFSHDIPLSLQLLLSGKTHNHIFFQPETLYNRASGFFFQKASPPNQIMMALVVVNFPFPQGWRTHLSSDFP